MLILSIMYLQYIQLRLEVDSFPKKQNFMNWYNFMLSKLQTLSKQ